jgi:hypothetical protein
VHPIGSVAKFLGGHRDPVAVAQLRNGGQSGCARSEQARQAHLRELRVVAVNGRSRGRWVAAHAVGRVGCRHLTAAFPECELASRARLRSRRDRNRQSVDSLDQRTLRYEVDLQGTRHHLLLGRRAEPYMADDGFAKQFGTD